MRSLFVLRLARGSDGSLLASTRGSSSVPSDTCPASAARASFSLRLSTSANNRSNSASSACSDTASGGPADPPRRLPARPDNEPASWSRIVPGHDGRQLDVQPLFQCDAQLHRGKRVQAILGKRPVPIRVAAGRPRALISQSSKNDSIRSAKRSISLAVNGRSGLVNGGGSRCVRSGASADSPAAGEPRRPTRQSPRVTRTRARVGRRGGTGRLPAARWVIGPLGDHVQAAVKELLPAQIPLHFAAGRARQARHPNQH